MIVLVFKYPVGFLYANRDLCAPNQAVQGVLVRLTDLAKGSCQRVQFSTTEGRHISCLFCNSWTTSAIQYIAS